MSIKPFKDDVTQISLINAANEKNTFTIGGDLVTKLTANLQSPKSNNLNYEHNKEYANNIFKHIVQETWKN